MIEVMIASVILGMSIAAAAAMLGTGLNNEHQRNIERQAYILAHSALERSEYTYPQDYDNIPEMSDTAWLNTKARSLNVHIDVTVSDEEVEDWPPHNTTRFRRLDATVRWSIDGESDSVVVSKLLARVK